jgi:hypothetical protein
LPGCRDLEYHQLVDGGAVELVRDGRKAITRRPS